MAVRLCTVNFQWPHLWGDPSFGIREDIAAAKRKFYHGNRRHPNVIRLTERMMNEIMLNDELALLRKHTVTDEKMRDERPEVIFGLRILMVKTDPGVSWEPPAKP